MMHFIDQNQMTEKENDNPGFPSPLLDTNEKRKKEIEENSLEPPTFLSLASIK